MAGALAGAAADTATFPLDTIRARVMVRALPGGMLHELTSLVRGEGVGALYKGLPIQLLASGPGCGLFYGTYETAKTCLRAWVPHKLNDHAQHALAAGAACLTSMLVYTPVEVIQQRAMVQRGVGSWSVLSILLKSEGVAGLYRGWGAGILTSVPYSMIYFLVYEALQAQVYPYLGPWATYDAPPVPEHAGCGATPACQSACVSVRVRSPLLPGRCVETGSLES